MTRPYIDNDRGMLAATVYERAPNDLYATIDPRCVAYLNKVWPLRGRRFIEPMAGYGDLVREVEKHGGVLERASDYHTYPNQDARIEVDLDAMWIPRNELLGRTMITNPPYSILRPVVEHFLRQAALEWLVILCRASQLHVQAMRPMLTSGQFHAVAPLPFRPIWFPNDAQKSRGPRHEYAWFIWQPRWGAEKEPHLLLGE
jgi:hypothetical protein